MEISNEIIRALGMTLVHSIWQGAVISAIVLFMLGMVKKSNARFRYRVSFSGLIALLAGFIVTFMLVYRNNQFLNELQHSVSFLQSATAPEQFWSISSASLTGKIFGFLEPYYPVLAIGWLTGFLFMSLRMSGGALLSRMSFRKGLRLPDAFLSDLFDSVQHELNLKIKVNLRVTYRMISPVVIGLLQPMVIIPAAAVTGLSAGQIKAVMVHELAHIKRLDHIFIIIQAIAQQVLFFHPVTWFLLHEIDRERENCCDDCVVHTNNNPINYIKALAMIQEMNLKVSAVNALTGKSNNLLNRIKRLIKPERRHSAAFRLTVILLFIATMSISAMALIISDQHNVKNSGNSAEMLKQQRDSEETFIIQDKDGDKKKMKIVYENDTIKEMTVNGKRLNKEEMKEYADEMRKMHLELEASREELAKVTEQIREAQKELELSRKHMLDSGLLSTMPFAGHQKLMGEFDWPQIDEEKFREFHLDEEAQENLWRNNEEIMKSMESEEFRESMKKAQERAMEAFESEEFRENLKKAQEDAMKAFQKERIKQKEYWDLHQDEFREQMKMAREHARKAFEEMKKNKKDWDFEFNSDDVMPFYIPGVPEIDAAPVVPDFHLAPGFPDINKPLAVPDIEGIPDMPVAPDPEIAPEVEIAPEEPQAPEAPEEPGVSEDEDLSPKGVKNSDQNSLDTLKELEEE